MRVIDHPIEPEELMAYLDGELTADRAAAAASHLEKCEECQSAAYDFRNVSARLDAWQVEPSRMIAPALPQKPKKWRWASAALVASPLLVATVLVTAVFLPSKGPQRFQIVDQFKGVVLDDSRSIPPMIVRTAQLTITVKNVDKARTNLDEILKRHGGYVGQLSIQGRALDTTLRVPTAQLEALMAELKQLGQVESESQTGEEVTQQSVDLEARLSNARNSEQRLADLLRQRTGKLSDVLDVEKEMERVRGEIERMEAEQKNLTNRVDFATVTVKLAEDSRAAFPGFRHAAVDGYRSWVESVSGAALFLLSDGPTVLFWSVVLLLPGRWLWRRSRRGAQAH